MRHLEVKIFVFNEEHRHHRLIPRGHTVSGVRTMSLDTVCCSRLLEPDWNPLEGRLFRRTHCAEAGRAPIHMATFRKQLLGSQWQS